MRSLLFATILAFAPLVGAQELVSGPQAVKEAQSKCAKGCVILSQPQLLALSDFVERYAEDAYKQGVVAGSEAVKNNRKLCPKDT